ncbi:MAG: DNA polymerase IV [Sedimentisphaerales bacterium]
MPTTRHILHIDMDAFYASVEQLDNPALKGKPIMVGGTVKQRGVVAAASYEIRKYGVHSAMPTSQALRLCPNAILLPVRMERYAEISKQIQEIFLSYTPDVEPLSLDEAFLDITGSIKLFGSPEKIGTDIKNRIKQELGLTASVGIAPNKFLAKLASDLQKPDGFVIITEDNKQKILDPLPVSKIWGIGRVTSKALQDRGINTIEQLRNTPVIILLNILGNQAQDILLLAQGIDDRPVESDKDAKSISAEETFPEDIIDKDILLTILHNQVEEVAQRLRAEKVEGKTITLKLRYKDFKTITRSHSFDSPTNTTFVLWEEAKNVFEKWYNSSSASKLRLLGFRVSGLVKEGSSQQRSLFSDPNEKKQKNLDSIYDKIKNKYGEDSLKRG